MMKKLRNSESPISTWFGGDCAVPSAWRRIASTMTMRVKDVMLSSTAGSSVSSVISRSTWMLSV